MYEGPVQNLIDEFGKLPGIGPKSAQRLAFHLLQAEPESVERLRTALQAVVEGVTYCEICGTVAANERCRICSDPRRDPSLVCVVEEPKDIEAIERTREFNGLYHVLGGALDPINGIGPPRSPRSSSPPTPTPRARPPAPTSRGCSAPSPTSWCPAWRRVCRWAPTSSSQTNSPWAVHCPGGASSPASAPRGRSRVRATRSRSRTRRARATFSSPSSTTHRRPRLSPRPATCHRLRPSPLTPI